MARADCRTLIAACREKELSPKTLENVARIVSSILSQAVEDNLLPANPAFRMGRYYRDANHRRKEINPLTKEETSVFLKAAKEHAPDLYCFFLYAVRTGMRRGELIGLQWGDLDFRQRFADVRRNIVSGRLATPRATRPEGVDLSRQLTDALRVLQVARKAEALRKGWGKVPDWVFCNKNGRPLDGDNIRRRRFHPILEKAGVRRIRFHDLRHTFASQLLAQNESLAYVRDQLGHASIQITVDTYGHLVPGTNRQAVDRLDDDETTRDNPGTTSEPGFDFPLKNKAPETF